MKMMVVGMTVKAGGVVVGHVTRHFVGPRLQWDFHFRTELPQIVVGNRYARSVTAIRNIIIGMYPDAEFKYAFARIRRAA